MKLETQHIALRAAIYVAQLLISRQPKNRIFHNLHHTLTVFEGAGKIGQAERLSEDDLEMVLLAAIFHDSGHIECYQGHEKVSARIASEWLEEQNYPTNKINRVTGCIVATTVPQKPRNKLEEVVCDADLIHLSFKSYPIYREMLRREWSLVLRLDYTNEEWINDNNQFLNTHQYFTDYGKQKLEPKKQQVHFKY